MDPLFDQSQKDLNRAPLDDRRILSGPFWAQLRVFLAVAKAKSYNKAGEELGMSRQTVAREIRRLQDLLGAVLLVPSRNGIQITDRGHDLATKLLSLDQMFFSLYHEMRADTREAEGQVRITATEAMTGFFIVPGLVRLNARYPKIRVQLRNPVNLISFRENQCDVMVGYGQPAESGLESRAAGFVHLLAIAGRSYVEEHGMPSWDTLASHRFIDADYYASETPTFASWRKAVAQGGTTHHCDNPFAYGLMVKAGLGIGLLGNFVTSDPELLPVGMGIHVKLPIYIHAQAERLKSRPVRVVFDWLAEVFSADKPVFRPELNLALLAQDAFSQSIRSVITGLSLDLPE
ncbi:MAG TPA: LysR family transcriptional regulator [Rhizomicrobium sp.]|nr:LysR family transcriptional regulator [Rhizomicrobium sp.]